MLNIGKQKFNSFRREPKHAWELEKGLKLDKMVARLGLQRNTGTTSENEQVLERLFRTVTCGDHALSYHLGGICRDPISKISSPDHK